VGVLLISSLGHLQAAVFPIKAVPIKETAPDGITDVRGGFDAGDYGAGGYRGGGYGQRLL
jgi:hypothetical protein